MICWFAVMFWCVLYFVKFVFVCSGFRLAEFRVLVCLWLVFVFCIL